MWPKAYHQALSIFNQDPKKAKQYLKDKRLTQNEKKILQGYFLFRDNLNGEVLELMKSISDPTVYVDIQKHILLGMASNSLSQISLAVEYFLKARALINEDDSCPLIKFGVLFKLFISYLNLHNVSEMQKLHSEMMALKVSGDDVEIKKLYASFMYQSCAGHIVEAKEALALLESHFPVMSEGMAISYLLKRFMFFVKLEDFTECHKILETMKLHRKYNLTENYNYMKLLLNNLSHDRPLYFSESDFKNSPLLLHMLQVIQSLNLKNLVLAGQFWKKLQEMDARNFQEDFHYVGEKNLFSLCLNKYLSLNKKVSQVGEWNAQCTVSGVSEKLNWVFENTSDPINKEDLFEFLFGIKPTTKDDMARLTKAIHKFREKHQVSIVSKRGTYALETLPERKKAL